MSSRLWAATLVGVWLVVTLWLYYRRRRAARAVTLPLGWGWMGRGGARLGLSLDLALTPQQYAAILAIELRVWAERTQRWQSGWIKLAKQGGAALERLATLYTLHTYGGQWITAIDENAARDIWERLSRPLRWFRWLGVYVQ